MASAATKVSTLRTRRASAPQPIKSLIRLLTPYPLERQFPLHRSSEVRRVKGDTSENLIGILEARLDPVVVHAPSSWPRCSPRPVHQSRPLQGPHGRRVISRASTQGCDRSRSGGLEIKLVIVLEGNPAGAEGATYLYFPPRRSIIQDDGAVRPGGDGAVLDVRSRCRGSRSDRRILFAANRHGTC